MFFKKAITLILINQLFTLKGFVLNEDISLKNSQQKIKQDVNSKLVSSYIDFSDMLQENEVKINKTIDEKVGQVMNKLNELGKLFGFMIEIIIY